jgi:hypothetical protein
MSEQDGEIILKRLAERLPGGAPGACSLCGTSDWTLNGYVSLGVQDRPSGAIFMGGPILPLVTFACTNCGNTHLLNLLLLGLDDLAGGRRDG